MSGAAGSSSERFAQFKLVLLGESAVGKSSLVLKFAKGTFEDNRESTIGAAFLTQSVRLEEQNATLRFEIWDTAGQERYKSLAPMYYRNANAAIVMFDLTAAQSLGRAKSWVKELKLQADDNIVIALVGNKLDLEDLREVGREAAENYAQETGLLYYETSAKTGLNVNELFREIAKNMPLDEYEQDREHEERSGIDLSRQAQNSCSC